MFAHANTDAVFVDATADVAALADNGGIGDDDAPADNGGDGDDEDDGDNDDDDVDADDEVFTSYICIFL